MARLAGPDIDGPITALRGLPFVAGFGQLSGNLERKGKTWTLKVLKVVLNPGRLVVYAPIPLLLVMPSTFLAASDVWHLVYMLLLLYSNNQHEGARLRHSAQATLTPSRVLR